MLRKKLTFKYDKLKKTKPTLFIFYENEIEFDFGEICLYI